MNNTLQRSFLTIVIYLCACACTVFIITPYSFTSFIGPAAGISTALVIVFGVKILLAIAVASIIFCLYLFFSLNLPIELSMVIITLLSIMLQGFWAKQLTLSEVNQQNWLNSRRYLLQFLFKIGPLTSLISAFTVVIVVILESKTLGNDLLFTFVSGWSGSLLFSVFFTPMILLTQGQQQLNLPKRTFIIIASFLAVFAIGLLFKISQNVQQHERHNTFKQVKNNVLKGIQKEIDITINDLNSLSAFFKASKTVDLPGFNLFAQQIFQTKSSVRVLEWAPIISHENRVAFEKKYNVILEKSTEGVTQKAGNRRRYAPIRFIYPYQGNEPVLGLDVLTNSNRIISMKNVINSKHIIASAPINLIQGNHTNLGILFITAVFSGSTDNLPNIEQSSPDDLLGFVVAVVQFKRFFQYISPSKTDKINLLIEDVTSPEPFILFGQQLNENHRYVESINLEVNSRQWRISFGEHQPWQLQQKNWQVWAMLFGTTLGGALFQVLILMMAVYSNELNSQVITKTRELIIAKEQSEQKNTAKTNFLHKLSNELQTPLHAIKDFCQQLSKSDNKEKNKIIQNIELAQDNMQKLLHMVLDLSKVELGESDVSSKPFDFHGFIARIEDMLLAKQSSTDITALQENTITFLIDSNVPHFINSDELRIQQLLVAFCDGVHELLKISNIRLTVKVHNHHLNSATLLFIFTNHDDKPIDKTVPFKHPINTNMALFSAQIAMAKEVCQLMGGDANLGNLVSGERVLTASIKILITSNEEQHAYQSHVFDEKEDK
ncbi:CHASE domain-containing protein [Candidatus Colwellia aromaticivorans]|uniref:CHASE domain-containing protein n=1 Tax=Candidatus Colwellia aromaticivorans TaxID=2267621 RepID=UPI000DF242F0|nr:CHASE domain-containing protein [Candidatus Colwellia aromaticivorans]